MNTFERRISEHMRAYGEGLEMTTKDINRLEQELEQKQIRGQAAGKARRGLVWKLAIAACAVTGVVLGALALRNDVDQQPQPAVPPPITQSDLAGLWRLDGNSAGWLWHFTDEGVDQSNAPATVFDPGEARAPVAPIPGGFTLDDDGCLSLYTASISSQGRMQATVTATIPKGCGFTIGEAMSFTRVSPVSVAGASLTSVYAPGDPKRVSSTSQLTGTWLLKGTGTVLAIAPSGGYVLHDLGSMTKPELGTVTIPHEGSAMFTPLTRSACTATYDSVITRTSSFAARLLANDCGRFAMNDTWIRLN